TMSKTSLLRPRPKRIMTKRLGSMTSATSTSWSPGHVQRTYVSSTSTLHIAICKELWISLRTRGLELASASREKLMIVLRDEPKFFGEFVRLNETWIRETFSPEDAALKAVSDPASILASGGHVFSAVEEERVMGVGALIRSGP